MICRSCKFSLQGSEKFCPECGAPLCEAKEEKNSAPLPLPEAPGIFFAPVKEKQEDEAPAIFRHQEPVREQEEKPPQRLTKSASKAPVVLMLLLLLVVLITGLFLAVEHFDIAPAIMKYLEGGTDNESTENTLVFAPETSADYNRNLGIIEPDISYSPTLAFVSNISLLSLRKGPADTYGLLESLEADTQLQILGGTSISDRWVYVYIPFSDCYGWVNAAFVTLYSGIEAAPQITTEPAEEEPETTEAYYEAPPEQ